MFYSLKVTVTDQLKIIDNKIKANQVQSDLDKLAAKTSALSFGELRKYEYLTGEDLGYQPSVLKKRNLIILYLVKLLLRDWIKKTKKEGFLRD